MEERSKEMDPEMGYKVSDSFVRATTAGVLIKGTLLPNILFEMVLNMKHYFINTNMHIYFRNVSGHSVRTPMAA